MGGHLPMVVDVVMPAGMHAAQGRLKGLLVSSEQRSPVCPDVPTVVELGMPDMVSGVFFGVVAPAGVPRPVVDRLNTIVREIIKDEGVKKRFAELGYTTTGSTPEAYHEKIRFETERWTKVVRDNNIKVEG